MTVSPLIDRPSAKPRDKPCELIYGFFVGDAAFVGGGKFRVAVSEVPVDFDSVAA